MTTQIPKTALEDARLSWKARGLLAFLLSLPPDAPFSSETLAEASPQGRSAALSGLRELRAAGYLSLERLAGANVGGCRYSLAPGLREDGPGR